MPTFWYALISIRSAIFFFPLWHVEILIAFFIVTFDFSASMFSKLKYWRVAESSRETVYSLSALSSSVENAIITYNRNTLTLSPVYLLDLVSLYLHHIGRATLLSRTTDDNNKIKNKICGREMLSRLKNGRSKGREWEELFKWKREREWEKIEQMFFFIVI